MKIATNNNKLDCQSRGIDSPFCIVSIQWQVDGVSGSTECEAWRCQYEIESLENAGYKITNVVRE